MAEAEPVLLRGEGISVQFGGLRALHVLLGLGGRFGHYRLVDEDRHVDAHGKRQGVGRTGVDFELPPIEAHDDPGVEHIVPELSDLDLQDFGAKRLDDVAQQVVGERAGDFHLLKTDGDSLGLEGADPDRKEALRIDLLEDDNAVL